MCSPDFSTRPEKRPIRMPRACFSVSRSGNVIVTMRRIHRNREVMLFVIDSDSPPVSISFRLSDISVVHPAMTRRAEHDEVLWGKAVRWRVVGQVEQVMDFAVPFAV